MKMVLLLALAVLAAASAPLAASPASLAAGPAVWEAQALPALEGECSSLAAIWGSSATEVFVAASCGTLLHYDGQAWALRDPGPLAAPGPGQNPSSISAIWGASASEIFLAGSGLTEQDGPHASVYRFGEGGWTARAVASGDTARIRGLWGTSASDIWAVGGDEGGGFAVHWNGTDWGRTISYEADGSLLDVNLYGVWGASASDIFAVGGGTWDRSEPVLLHYDGLQWTAAETGPWNRLNAVWGSSASDVFAVGVGGTIVHYDGAAWAPQESGTAADLTAVWGTSASSVFAAGHVVSTDTAAILYYNGSSWSRVSDVTRGGDLRGLWGSSASDVFAVGSAGTVLHYGDPSPAGDGEGPATHAARPLIASVQSRSGRPGDDLTVSITGTNLGGVTRVSFGSGIAVNEVSVISEAEIRASIAIDSGAAAGRRTVIVTTPEGAAMMPGGFLVEAPAPAKRLWVYPLAGAAGVLAAAGLLALLRLGLRRRPSR